MDYMPYLPKTNYGLGLYLTARQQDSFDIMEGIRKVCLTGLYPSTSIRPSIHPKTLQ